MTRNIGASARARLKKYADEHKEEFNLTLTHYGLERLLYRMSISRHADTFLLKGALLFSLWYRHPHRPTRDVDLLGFGPSDIASLVAIFREICAVAADDGVKFGIDDIKGAEIRTTTGYGGVRIDVPAELDGARMSLQFDIAFGDAVTPGPEEVQYPVLLQDMPAPKLRAYPKYTAFAEKLHAICLFGMVNTRLKDYFDLHVLLHEEALDPAKLHRATTATFERRKMPMPQAVPVGLTDAFATDTAKQTQWKAFLKKNKLDPLDLGSVVSEIREALAKLQAEGAAPSA